MSAWLDRAVLLLCLIFALGIAASWAQTPPPATIGVTVTDATGSPIEGADIWIVPAVSNLSSDGKTGAEGKDEIEVNGGDVYNVKVYTAGRGSGEWPNRETYIFVRPGEKVALRIQVSDTSRQTKSRDDSVKSFATAAGQAAAAGDRDAYDGATAAAKDALDELKSDTTKVAAAVEQFRLANDLPKQTLKEVKRTLSEARSIPEGFRNQELIEKLESYERVLNTIGWRRSVLEEAEKAAEEIPEFPDTKVGQSTPQQGWQFEFGGGAMVLQNVGHHTNAGLGFEQDVLTGGGSLAVRGRLDDSRFETEAWYREGSAKERAAFGALARTFLQFNGGIQLVGAGAGAGEHSLTSEVVDVGTAFRIWPRGLQFGGLRAFGVIRFNYREDDERHRLDYPGINFFIDQEIDVQTYSFAIGPGVSTKLWEHEAASNGGPFGNVGAKLFVDASALLEVRHDRGKGSYHTAQALLFDTTVSGDDQDTSIAPVLRMISGIRFSLPDGTVIELGGEVGRESYASLEARSGAEASLEHDQRWSYGGRISVRIPLN